MIITSLYNKQNAWIFGDYSWDILVNTRNKFHISAHPCIILYFIIKDLIRISHKSKYSRTKWHMEELSIDILRDVCCRTSKCWWPPNSTLPLWPLVKEEAVFIRGIYKFISVFTMVKKVYRISLTRNANSLITPN